MLKVAKKYIIAFPKDKEESVLDLIKDSEGIEIESNFQKEGTDENIQNIDYLISSASFAVNFLSSFAKKESFIYKLNNPKIQVKKEDVAKFKNPGKLNEMVQKVIELEKELSSQNKELKNHNSDLKEIEMFEGLDFIPRETEFSRSFILKLEEKKVSESKFYIKPINALFYKAFLLKEKEQDFLKFIEESRGEIVDYRFPEIPSLQKKKCLEEIRKIKKREDEIKKEIAKIALSYNDFKIYHDVLCLERRQAEAGRKTGKTGILNYMIFWALEKEKKELELKCARISRDIRIADLKLEEQDKPPVAIENNRWIAPFQSVTDIFGLPAENEIDPTPYLAFFFIIYFGICITDAAYGLMLAIFSLIPLLFFKKRFGKNKLLKLLFYGGISTFVMGVLFGSYFGTSPSSLRISFMERLKVIDPIKDTVLFMGVSFALGYIQICFSQIVKIIKGLKFKDADSILGGISWILLYLSFGLYVLSFKFAFLGVIAPIFIFSSLAFLLWEESRGQKIFLRPLIGAIKILQGMIGTASDILSYSRLMALGLGTGVIALIVNQIAFLFKDMIPYFGWIVAALILVGGHIFNLGINALGGFIHSARLQFVEFFPKFLEGGGRRLKPLGPDLKYIEIN
ncbi:MAG: hypothetical protein A2365_03060 [Candidatus Nealsonbacteria bacterium RIFOXYB1_FULL_40_15]|uniref:Uncharacterized protein n=1 Tax=Candidatus Nealsonbacteria bacterium RIFOXYB1_FULL_40_15 TaxID=1801677 RepID=A0A1G2ENT1_9BACT|nr:MAG: hypothetical protein A2365_03060 [Candidatus Nealsonbacteria bacterium RIFOXYB1_FULL_40_15]OGZ29889.1 MAG: hypothetical protein A2562_02095 [Candidatus Nealsonbacteria bacterium RIFOXYD1_FULL_39_11]